MKYLLFTLLLTNSVYGQDTLKLKNRAGIVVSPSIFGTIPIDQTSYGSPFTYEPLFTSSYYLEYGRNLSKRLNLTAGAGLFMEGYNATFDYNYFPALYPSYSKQITQNYNYNVSLHLKPKFIITDKKILLYVGLSAQFNYYLTSLSYYTYFDYDGKNVKNQSLFGAIPTQNPLRIYCGVISGISYRFKRFLFVAEPEFKIRVNYIAINDNTNPYLYYYPFTPFSVSLNLIAYYEF